MGGFSTLLNAGSYDNLLIDEQPLQNLSLTPRPMASGAPPNFLTSSVDKTLNWLSGKNANTTGMTPAVAKAEQAGQAVHNFSLVASIAGGINSAISSFYAAKAAQSELKSQASSFAFQSNMEAINASREELTAQSIQEAGKSQIANYTMQAGEQKAGATASMAARGIALGVGSAADVSASMDIEKDLNVIAINSNTVRQAWAAREQETNYQNASLLDRTSALNANRSGASISPVGGMVNSLMGSATQVAGQWDYNEWLRKRLAAGLPVPQSAVGG
jgi:hypothetical protein